MGLWHVIEAQQFDRQFLEDLIQKTDDAKEHRETNDLKGRIMATLFYEPSTRTGMSFESAMLKQGGNVLSRQNAGEFSSAIKGESIEDTIRVVDGYVDCIVIRHPEEGFAARAAAVSDVPVINAGDGKGQHPTQALLDIYTIHNELGRLDGITVAMVGDLAFGRTVRSLSYLLAKFEDVRMIFVSPENLRMGDDIKGYLSSKGIDFRESADLSQALETSDIIYMTRIQKERMSKDEYVRAKGAFVIDENNFGLVRPSARIMHPLPKIEEIGLSLKTEDDKRVAYFRQAENGLYVRMALLKTILS